MSWKSFYIQSSLFKKVSASLKRKRPTSIKTWSRGSTILPSFVGCRFRVYSGKEFFLLSITPEMVGFKFGEFVPTRAKYEFKKKKKGKKK